MTIDEAAFTAFVGQAEPSPPDLDPGTYEMVLRSPDGFDAKPPVRTIDVVPRGS